MGRKFGKVTDAILNAVADGIEIIEYSAYKPGALMAYGFPFVKEVEAERAREQIAVTIHRLKKRKYIRETRIRKERALQLTVLGERYVIRSRDPLPPMLPEGLKTLVSFDIPERERTSRQAFRQGLKALGFRKLHESLWVSERDWTATIFRDLTMRGIGGWVKIVHGRVVENATLDGPPVSL
ncbi:hypothetical protein HY479_04235 [Candidatus Uhrbacteria bacterium]|nr:hypothetical protein [Candidatus Uhrbacteria bacterium]